MNTATFSPWPSVLALLVVLGLIIGIGWLLKRSKFTLGSQPLAMRALGGISLGAREKLLLVEIDDEWHVLGVTAHSITSVTRMPKRQMNTDTNGPSGAHFLATLQARLKQKS